MDGEGGWPREVDALHIVLCLVVNRFVYLFYSEDVILVFVFFVSVVRAFLNWFYYYHYCYQGRSTSANMERIGVRQETALTAVANDRHRDGSDRSYSIYLTKAHFGPL